MALVRAYTAQENPLKTAFPAGYVVIERAVVKPPLFDLHLVFYASREAYEAGGDPWLRRTMSGDGFDGRAPVPAATMMYAWLAQQPGFEGAVDDGL